MHLPSFAGRTLFFAAVAPLALFIAGCDAPETAAQEMAPVPVTVVTLRQEAVTLRRELPGRASASLVAEVRPQVDGIVRERLYTEGSLVQQGQPLYQLDDTTYRADHASAVAALARAQATLQTADLNAKRSAQLLGIDAVSRQEDEAAQSLLRQAQADVMAAQAAVDRTDAILGYARIVSPITGRIGKSAVTQGALVTANQAAPLATVQKLDPIYLDVTQSSAEWLSLRRQIEEGKLRAAERLPVEILLEDGSVYEQPGRLAFSDVTVDPTTGAFALRIVVPNPRNVLLPGMYLRAVLAMGTRDDGLLVPQRGVTRGPQGATHAMVVTEDGKVRQQEVRVSQAVGDKWLVESGLQAGDRVVVEGLQKIQPGAPVQATEFGSEPPAAASTGGEAPAGSAAAPH